MYEKYNGTSRLVSALQCADTKRLAIILNYHERQLKEDIKALKDVYNDVEKERENEDESF